METPRNTQIRGSVRNPTPRLSERKKNLFSSKEEAQDDLLSGIEPLDFLKTKSHLGSPQSKLCIESTFTPSNDLRQECLPPHNPFASGSKKDKTETHIDKDSDETAFVNKDHLPENMEAEEQLEELFNSSMMIGGNVNTILQQNKENGRSVENGSVSDTRSVKKRQIEVPESYGNSPKRKLSKVNTLSPPTISIPTKVFYSNSKSPPIVKQLPDIWDRSQPKQKKTQQNHRKTGSINKGVSHKIRRPSKPSGINRYSHAIDVEHILKNIRNEKLRNLIIAKRQERAQIEDVHRILKCSQNPIEMARPLTAITDTQMELCVADVAAQNAIVDVGDGFLFSDIECESEDDDNLVSDLENELLPHPECNQIESELLDSNATAETLNRGRKFFKSGHSRARKEVRITDSIKASICNGKISLMEQKKPTRKKMRLKKNSAGNEFSAEQATVEAILKNLDDTNFGDTSLMLDVKDKSARQIEPSPVSDDPPACDDDNEYSIFRSRIPCNATDPDKIEQQHILLDFLINNNICNEKNFNIFIADPENHLAEAAEIVDAVVVVNKQTDHEQGAKSESEADGREIRMPEEEELLDNCDIIEETTESNNRKFIKKTPVIVDIDCKVDSSICSSSKGKPHQSSVNLFPLFYAGKCQPLSQKSCRRIERSWTGGYGASQYQIDAGQKGFGARQCPQCGLVYTLHEPEEEKLHREYHTSLYVLRFKGWIDEDVVSFHPEWGVDGRIIKISDSSHAKRKERLRDVLKIIDKELGFSSYIFPKSFVAFLAVRKSQIAGACLVHPLEKANKYICVDGVDCCTEEEFEARCGISRIWVSPLHRRLRIATKLIQAVQFNAIIGEEISLDQIAFSAPTESGKQFARVVTSTDNFLVYQ